MLYITNRDSNYWEGPGIVIGHDNKQVIVKHGGSFVRVHPCSLRKVNEEYLNNDGNAVNDNIDDRENNWFAPNNDHYSEEADENKLESDVSINNKLIRGSSISRITRRIHHISTRYKQNPTYRFTI